MKRIAWVYSICIFAVFILISCKRVNKNINITREEAYRAFALSLGNTYDISRKDSNTKYIDFLIEKNILKENIKKKRLDRYLTAEELIQIYNNLPQDAVIGDWIFRKNKSEAIDRDDFYVFYDYWCRNKDSYKYISLKEDIFYEIEAGTVYTNSGDIYKYIDDEIIKPYLDKKISFYVAGDEIIYIKDILDEEIYYNKVIIRQADEEEITIVKNSIERKIKSKIRPDYKITANSIADIHMIEGQIVDIDSISLNMSGRVLSIDENIIEIEDKGFFEVSKDLYIYCLEDGKIESLKQIELGSPNYEFSLENNIINTGIKKKTDKDKHIRVLIKNNDFNTAKHYNINLSSQKGLKIKSGENISYIDSLSEYNISNKDTDLKDGDRIFIESLDENCDIYIDSIKRSLGTPSYGGTIEIIKRDGLLYIINDIDVEEYLRKVVPSEMPFNYGLEALKAQAVCARTYAYKSIAKGSDLRKYGAHVDDSISYQVYNNIPTNEFTDKAIKETKYETVMYEDEYAYTFYYSTSPGIGTDAFIWGGDENKYPYIVSRTVSPKREELDLTTDEKFKAFLFNKNTEDFERNEPFYRWQTVITSDILRKEIEDIGNIQNIIITKRGAGGVASQIKIVGSDSYRIIEGDDEIRSILGNKKLIFNRFDGKTSSGMSSLPSSFIYIETSEPDENNIVKFTIYGGGYGHGVGMSQNAAKAMAASGMNYKEIIEFFYDKSLIR